MNRRQREILRKLLNLDSGILGADLAKSLNVSSRTIIKDVKELNELLIEHHIKIDSSNKKGYFLNEYDKEELKRIWQQIYIEDTMLEIPTSPNERQVYILLLLAFDNYVSTDEFLERMYISDSTLKSDVKNAIGLIKKFDCIQMKIEADKYSLEGSEEAIRNMVSGILSQKKDEILFNKYCRYIFPDNSFQDNVNLFLELIPEESRKLGFAFSGKGLFSLAVDIALMIKRNQLSFIIPSGKKLQHSQFLRNLQFRIESKLNQTFNSEEWTYIQERILSKRLSKSNHVVNQIERNSSAIVDLYLDILETKFNLFFRDDILFRQGLLNHMGPMLNRLKLRHYEENQNKYLITENYSAHMIVAKELAFIIENQLGYTMNLSEISYIAVHLIAALQRRGEKKLKAIILCDQATIQTELIKSKIENQFKEKLVILYASNTYQFHNVEREEVDLIITTDIYQLESGTSKMMVNVSEFLFTEDLVKIKNSIDSIQLEKKKNLVREFFKYPILNLQKKYNLEEAVNIFLKEYDVRGSLQEKNHFEMRGNNSKMTPFLIINDVAIVYLHDYSVDNAIGLVYLYNPIKYGAKTINLVYLVMLKPVDIFLLENIVSSARRYANLKKEDKRKINDEKGFKDILIN